MIIRRSLSRSASRSNPFSPARSYITKLEAATIAPSHLQLERGPLFLSSFPVMVTSGNRASSTVLLPIQKKAAALGDGGSRALAGRAARRADRLRLLEFGGIQLSRCRWSPLAMFPWCWRGQSGNAVSDCCPTELPLPLPHLPSQLPVWIAVPGALDSLC